MGSVYKNDLFNKELLAERQRQWDRFHAWERSQLRKHGPRDPDETIGLMGDMIDWFLSMHPSAARDTISQEKIDGIRNMHRCLAVLGKP